MNLGCSNRIYGTRNNGGRHGDVFTSPTVVRFILDQVGYRATADLRHLTILEPSCGEGEFLVEIASRLIHSAERYHFDANEAFRRNVRAYDIDARKIEYCGKRLDSIGIHPSRDNLIVADFLRTDAEQADIIVGNPPYIRYENTPKWMIDYCRSHFETYHYRCDLYVPFFEKTLSLLNSGGRHSFICSNRWLKNEYGKKLRKLIASKYSLKTIVDLEQAAAFQEKVLAYPAITCITASNEHDGVDYAKADSLDDLERLSFAKCELPVNEDWTSLFSSVSSDKIFSTIEEQGFKIGIGAATGADSIFVSAELPKHVERELILPSVAARNLRGDQFKWHGEYLLNPYKPDGTLVELSDYPLASVYLERHRERLAARYVARKTPSKWYKTIDRITPSLLYKPKILLPEMSGNSFIFVDDGAFYPLHNIYYIIGRSLEQLRLLAAFLMSDFVRDQLASVTNTMNGGFSRWQSQHLRKLRIPDLGSISNEDCNIILSSYESRDLQRINSAVGKLLLDIKSRAARRLTS